MALHLSRIFKDQKWSLGAHFFEPSRFGEEERRKREKELGFPRDQALV